MSQQTPSPMIEYVILIYASGTVTTVIGFADVQTAITALRDNCSHHNASWGYLYHADGSLIDHYRR